MKKSMKHIFVSSTFRDMQAERDMVQERMIPKLRARAREYGENVYAIDLRWGVDTTELDSDEGARKVLSVCFDEIDRSHPYMLIFVGDRYGWVPPEATIKTAVNSRSEYFDMDNLDKSITALEIEYGALSEKYADQKNCVVCMRLDHSLHLMPAEERKIYEDTEPEAVRRLRELKHKLEDAFGNRIIYYNCDWSDEKHKNVNFRVGSRDLEDVLADAFVRIFQEDWQAVAALSEAEREQRKAEAFLEDQCRAFCGREKLLDRFYAQVTSDGEHSVYVLRGEAGAGKTALLSMLAKRLKENGEDVFLSYAGTTARNASVYPVIDDMTEYFEKLWGDRDRRDRKEFSSTRSYLSYLTGLVCRDRKVYLVLDAVDRYRERKYVDNLILLPDAHPNLRCIVSTTESLIFDEAHSADFEFFEMPRLSAGEKSEMIGDTYREIKDEICQKKSSDQPMYIKLCLARLKMMGFEELASAGGEREIIDVATGVIRKLPDDLTQAVQQILETGIARVTDDGTFLHHMVNFFAASKSGLRESDLVALVQTRGCTFNSLEFSCFMGYFDFLFRESADGLYSFAGRAIQQALSDAIWQQESSYAEAIKDHIKSLPKEDILFRQDGYAFAVAFSDHDLGVAVCAAAGCEKPDTVIEAAIKQESLKDGGEFLETLIPSVMLEETMVRERMSFFCERFLNLFDYRDSENTIVERLSTKIEATVKMAEFLLSSKLGETENPVPVAAVPVYEEARKWYLAFGGAMAERMNEQGNTELAQMYANQSLNTAVVRKPHEEGKAEIPDRLSYAKSLLTKGTVLIGNQDYEEALKYLLTLRDGIDREDPETMEQELHDVWVKSMAEINRCKVRLGMYDSAEEENAVLMQLWDLVKDTPGRRKYLEIVANAFLFAYEAARARKDYALAEEKITLCIELEKERLTENTSSLAGGQLSYAYSMAAELYEEQNDTVRAEEYYKKCYQIYEGIQKNRRDIIGAGDLKYAAEKLFHMCMEAGRGRDAVVYLRTMLETGEVIYRESRFPGKEAESRYLKSLIDQNKLMAGLCRKQGMMEEEIEALTKTMELYEELNEIDPDPEIWKLTSNYCVKVTNLCELRNQAERAMPYFLRCFEYRKRYYEAHPNTQNLIECAEILSAIHMAYGKLCDYDNQLKYLFLEGDYASRLASADSGFTQNAMAVYSDIFKLCERLKKMPDIASDSQAMERYTRYQEQAKNAFARL